jgi:hypothetical protein
VGVHQLLAVLVVMAQSEETVVAPEAVVLDPVAQQALSLEAQLLMAVVVAVARIQLERHQLEEVSEVLEAEEQPLSLNHLPRTD